MLSFRILIDNINEFNLTLIDKIKKIDLNKWIETVTSHLNKKESNTNELYMKYSTEIIQKTYLFNRNELMLKHINEVTIDSLCKFINIYILNNKFKSIIQITK
jgi:secreted Zn-dependent insulinase-like peptidase